MNKIKALLTFIFLILYCYANAQCNITVDPNQTYCGDSNPAVRNIRATGPSGALFYQSQTSTTALDFDTRLVPDDQGNVTYYADTPRGGCGVNNRVAVTINIPSPPAAAAAQSFCDYDTDLTTSRIRVIGRNVLLYQGRNGTTALNGTESIVNKSIYSATQEDLNSGCTSARKIIVASILTTDALFDRRPIFCESDQKTLNDIEIESADRDIIITSIDYYDTNISRNRLSMNTRLENNENYFAQINSAPCDIEGRFEINPRIIVIQNPVVTSPHIICRGNNNRISDLQATSMNSTEIRWYNSATGGTQLALTDELLEGNYFAEGYNSLAECTSQGRTLINVSYGDATPPTIDSTPTFCGINGRTIVSLNPFMSSPEGTIITWHDAAENGRTLPDNTLLNANSRYYAKTNGGVCPSTIRTEVSIIIEPLPAPTLSGTLEICSINGRNLTNLEQELLTIDENQSIRWYDAPTNGNEINNTTTLIENQSYYAALQDPIQNCESPTRTKITVTLTPLPAPTLDRRSSFCTTQSKYLSDLESSLIISENQFLKWYDAPSNGNEIAITTSLTEGQSYFAALEDRFQNCESVARATVGFDIVPIDKPLLRNVPSFCSITNRSLLDLEGSLTVPENFSIKWYEDRDNTIEIPTTTNLEENNLYFAVSVDATGSCISPRNTSVNFIIEPISPAQLKENPSFCSLNGYVVNDLNDFISYQETFTITWYDAVSEGNIIQNTAPLEENGNYYASITDDTGNCSSVRRTKVGVSIEPIGRLSKKNEPLFCSLSNRTVDDLSSFLQMPLGYVIDWYTSSNSATEINKTTPLTEGRSYFAELKDKYDNCKNPQRIELIPQITILKAPEPIQGTPIICDLNKSKIIDLNEFLTFDDSFTINWYDSPREGQRIPNNQKIEEISYYAELQGAGANCVSSERTVITPRTVDVETPKGEGDYYFCDYNKPTVADLTAKGTNLQWYENYTGINNPLEKSVPLENDKNYYARSIDGNSQCVSPVSLPIRVTIKTIASPNILEIPVFCHINKIILNKLNNYAFPEIGGSIVWYTTPTGGSKLSSDTILENKVYYAEAIDNKGVCVSQERVPASVKISNPDLPNISNKNFNFCELERPTLATLENRLELESKFKTIWYSDSKKNEELNETTLLEDGKTYYTSIKEKSSSCVGNKSEAITVNTTTCDENKFSFLIPNGFSPNNDGINDILKMGKINFIYPDYTIEIFNRYGNIVFKGNSNKNWNGTSSNNSALPIGTYFYVLNPNKNNSPPIEGNIYLTR